MSKEGKPFEQVEVLTTIQEATKRSFEQFFESSGMIYYFRTSGSKGNDFDGLISWKKGKKNFKLVPKKKEMVCILKTWDWSVFVSHRTLDPADTHDEVGENTLGKNARASVRKPTVYSAMDSRHSRIFS